MRQRVAKGNFAPIRDNSTTHHTPTQNVNYENLMDFNVLNIVSRLWYNVNLLLCLVNTFRSICFLPPSPLPPPSLHHNHHTNRKFNAINGGISFVHDQHQQIESSARHVNACQIMCEVA